jgi:hypothetical protein
MKTLMIIGEKIGAILLWVATILAMPIAMIVGLRKFPKYIRVSHL